MKKFAVIILALLYLTASCGATINIHYCMGKLRAWDLSHKQGKCGTCGMEKKGHKGCCNDEKKTFRLDKDQKISEPSFQFLPNFSETVAIAYTDLPIGYTSIVTDNPVAHAPPPSRAISLLTLHCVFRI